MVYAFLSNGIISMHNTYILYFWWKGWESVLVGRYILKRHIQKKNECCNAVIIEIKSNWSNIKNMTNL